MDIGIRSRKTTKSDYPIVNDGGDEEAGVKKFKPFFTQENRWITSLDDKIRLFMLTMVGFYLRGMKLGFPYFVTDLELETTRQVNWYMKGKFFIGQFPPLTGLINVALARLVGYYGTENLSFGGQ
jgi:dolichyl-phosphate-mannose--protein O-mannosyl transferase